MILRRGKLLLRAGRRVGYFYLIRRNRGFSPPPRIVTNVCGYAIQPGAEFAFFPELAEMPMQPNENVLSRVFRIFAISE